MIQKQPLDENHLRLLIANGLIEVAQQIITDNKLPYCIENGQLKDLIVGSELYLKRFITIDADTILMKEDVPKYAKCQYEVLITGETGTGKELLGKAMKGDRVGKAVFINCSGLPDTLIESELFGYVKGSFTGATGDRQGMLAAAKNGMAFFDEVGELPLNVQAKLLRCIQEKQVRRVGAIIDEPINCKMVFATHRNLKKMVEQGTFRQDLYARISTLELHVKPLRDRTCDIIPIIQSMRFGEEFLAKLKDLKISPTSLSLSDNVRSLQKYVVRFEVLGSVKL